jgi:hypothetical protein
VAKATIGFGVGLIVLGVVAYFGTGMASWTALIPAFGGIPLALCGVIALKERFRKHAMHVAVVLGLVGFAGTVMGVVKVARMIAGETLARPEAAIVQAIMAVTLLVFLAMAVKSFIDARRARASAS